MTLVVKAIGLNMTFSLHSKELNLTEIAKEGFKIALHGVDPKQAVQKAVQLNDGDLWIANNQFNLQGIKKIYSVAFGKAAIRMAEGLTASLGNKIEAGLVSSIDLDTDLPPIWRIFRGGHPIPNEQSLAAGKVALQLLENANNEDSLIIFLVSGGGSAMFEMPIDKRINLNDLQITNKILVNCGATISEINEIRRRISAIKGGGLSQAARKAKQVTLIVSDTNEDEAFNVASGPSITSKNRMSDAEISQIIERYDLKRILPKSVFDCLDEPLFKIHESLPKNQNWHVLLENSVAIKAIERFLLNTGFVVEIVSDLIEAPIEIGCHQLVEKLAKLRSKVSKGKPVAIVSGGEFKCPVRGNGIGGRNLESALRTAILFDELKNHQEFLETKFTALFAGTDGIDGNSPAAGAVCNEATIKRAKKKNFDAQDFLNRSDSFNFLKELGETLETGSTGTNVRDVRILLAN